MERSFFSRWGFVPIAVLASLAFGIQSLAQDIEPRAYSNAPVGVNFVITGYAFTDGGVSFDPTLPVEDPKLRTSNLLVAYARVLDLAGKTAKFDVVLPYTWLSGSALFAGKPVERVVSGFGDSRLRLSWNLVGSPALGLKDFPSYHQDLIVGASLQVTVPASQYDPSRLVNIGTHRWSFKPEIGISKALGRWTLEAQGAATFFTTNHDFYGGRTRSQDPLYSLQGHVIYSFKGGLWGSLDATYFWGGQTTLDGLVKEDRQENWRVGGILAIPVDRKNSFKISVSNGVSARTGNSYFLAAVAWQYRWGGGL